MPQDLRIRVGVEVATITLGGTPAQVAAALARNKHRRGGKLGLFEPLAILFARCFLRH